jgi:hypothetical protein
MVQDIVVNDFDVCGVIVDNVKSMLNSVLVNSNDNTNDVSFKVMIKTPHNNTTILSFVNRFYCRDATYVRSDITSKRSLSYRTSRVRKNLDVSNLSDYLVKNKDEIETTIVEFLEEELPKVFRKVEKFQVDILWYHGDSSYIVLENYNYILLK